MTFYMVRDKTTGLYYKRGCDWQSPWVPQEEASVWTTRAGAAAVLGNLTRRQRGRKATCHEPEVNEIVTETGGKITFVTGDDWEGVYLDGKLIAEGHSVQPEQILEALDIPTDTISADLEWLHDRGRLPENLDDVKPE